jgi:hypothetical protein
VPSESSPAVKKHNTAKTTTRRAELARLRKLTIGMDLGDRVIRYCILNEEGDTIFEGSVPTTKQCGWCGQPADCVELCADHRRSAPIPAQPRRGMLFRIAAGAEELRQQSAADAHRQSENEFWIARVFPIMTFERSRTFNIWGLIDFPSDRREG